MLQTSFVLIDPPSLPRCGLACGCLRVFSRAGRRAWRTAPDHRSGPCGWPCTGGTEAGPRQAAAPHRRQVALHRGRAFRAQRRLAVRRRRQALLRRPHPGRRRRRQRALQHHLRRSSLLHRLFTQRSELAMQDGKYTVTCGKTTTPIYGRRPATADRWQPPSLKAAARKWQVCPRPQLRRRSLLRRSRLR